MKALDKVFELGKRFDSWVNPFLGFGSSRDKAAQSSFALDAPILDIELSSMFNGDDMSAKIVSLLPSEAMRQGFEINSEDKDTAKAIKDRCDFLNADKHLVDGATWGRLYGGNVTVIGADDLGHAATPLREERVKGVNFLQNYDRRYALRHTRYTDPRNPKYQEPDVYHLQSLVGGSSYVHESRCFVFRGAPTDIQQRERLASWDLSVLQKCYTALRAFNTMHSAGEIMMTEASTGVFKMKGLLQMIAGNQMNNLQSRAIMLDMSKSVARSIFLDADSNEEYSKQATSFANVPDMLDRAANRLSAASGIPVTLLMGQSPAGLNATGASDVRIFYDTVKTYQTAEMLPRLTKLVKLIAISIGKPGFEFSIGFPPLWQETPKEESERKKLIAETDQIYINTDVLTPDEVALNRFGGADFSDEIKIDPKHRIGSPLPKTVPGQPPPGMALAPRKAPPQPPPVAPPDASKP